MLEPAQQGAEAAAVLGQVDRVDRRAEQRHAGLLERAGELQRRLAAELDDHALRALLARRRRARRSSVSGSK